MTRCVLFVFFGTARFIVLFFFFPFKVGYEGSIFFFKSRVRVASKKA